MFQRRHLLFGTAAFAATGALALAPQVRADDAWPQRTVSIVVPFAAGGSADLLGRLLAQHMQAKFNVPFVVENRGGAGGSIGTAVVAKAAADGHTLLIGTVSTHAINPSLYAHLSFDVEKDFTPISLLVRLPNLLVVNNDVPARTVPELVAWLKANEGKVSFGSSGNGTSSHLAAVMFQLATGTQMTHVPFRSTADEMNSMMGGSIQLAIDSMTTLWPLAKGSQVRAIAVSTPQRVAAAPDVPTIGETVKGFEATGWQGLYAPGGTPRPIVDKIAAEVKRIFNEPQVATALANVGGEPAPMTPDAFAEFVRTERTKWAEVVKAAGVRIQ
jgi:tripartite-type tricarboxylate transporter receptor subunit TctC